MFIYRSLKWNLDESESDLYEKMFQKIGLESSNIANWHIDRVSTDARKKNNIFQIADVAFTLVDEKENDSLLKRADKNVVLFSDEVEITEHGNAALVHRPIIVGSGPCGLFAAYELALRGYNPLVVERGKSVESRGEDVRRLWEKGELDEESNVLFGEGGAGTFSDGKLTSRSNDPKSRRVIKILAENGAQHKILRDSKPHVGSDVLRKVVINMRNKIISLGGEFLFETKLVDFDISSGTLKSIALERKGETESIAVDVCILAIGHSARDTYSLLAEKKLALVPKNFAVGVRIEHLQSFINEAQHGKFAAHPRLGSAEYQLSHKACDSRGVYTFCMCPGGFVISSSSENNGLAVNGMSMSDRGAENANSAVVVQVGPSDYGSGMLDGVNFQRYLEQKAYASGGGKFKASAQKLQDFFDKKKSTAFGKVTPSYMPGVNHANLWDILPPWCANGIAEGIKGFSSKMKGFDDGDSVLTGVETRTSAPLRIQRNDTLQSEECHGLYPAGEGAGYAGGIVSAALDGMRISHLIIKEYAPFNK